MIEIRKESKETGYDAIITLSISVAFVELFQVPITTLLFQVPITTLLFQVPITTLLCCLLLYKNTCCFFGQKL